MRGDESLNPDRTTMNIWSMSFTKDAVPGQGDESLNPNGRLTSADQDHWDKFGVRLLNNDRTNEACAKTSHLRKMKTEEVWILMKGQLQEVDCWPPCEQGSTLHWTQQLLRALHGRIQSLRR
jgi:hypothetical protein